MCAIRAVRAGRCRVNVSVYFLVLVACALVLDNSGTAPLALLCVAVHESGHLLVLRLLGVRLEEADFRLFGIELRPARGMMLDYRGEVLLDLAGGAANLLLAAAAFGLFRTGIFPPQMRALAAFSLVLGGFNLLPIGPLDGGRALEAALCRRLPCDAAANVVTAVSAVLVVPLATAGFLLLWHTGRNPSLLVAGVYLAASLFVKPARLYAAQTRRR